MKKKFIKSVSLIISLIMIISMIPLTAFAQDTVEPQFTVKFKDGSKPYSSEIGIDVVLTSGSFSTATFSLSVDGLNVKSSSVADTLVEKDEAEEFVLQAINETVLIDFKTKAYSASDKTVAEFIFENPENKAVLKSDIKLIFTQCTLYNPEQPEELTPSVSTLDIPNEISEIKAGSLTLSDTSKSLYLGQSAVITSKVLPECVASREVTWSSDNDNAATVTNGTINTVGVGTANIKAVVDGIEQSCKISVLPVVLTSTKKVSLYEGDNYSISSEITPEELNGSKNLIYSSSDETVATVNNSGKVSAKKAGTATITVTVDDGSGVSSKCVVKVVSYIEKITIGTSTLPYSLSIGKSITVKASVSPSTADSAQLAWSSSDKSVATVDNAGKIIAVAAGQAIITCSATDDSGVKATCTVNVKLATPKLSYKNISRTSINISWGAISGAKQYTLQRYSSSSNSWSTIKYTSSELSYTDTSRSAGKSYKYRLIAGNGNASCQSYSTLTATARLAKPTGVSAKNVNVNAIKVYWNRVSGATGYYVYRSKNGSSYSKVTTITSGTTLNYTNKGLSANTNYYYVIKAYYKNSSGVESSTISLSSEVAGAKTIPQKPTNVKAKKKTSTSVTVLWSKVSGATGYVIYRSTTGKSGSWTKIKTTSSLSYTNSSLKKGNTYYYCVKAYTKVGKSNIYSATSSAASVKL